jgi:hypothetical protein
MKHVSSGLLLLGFFLSVPLYADNSCECPKLGCDPCSVEKGIKFFSEKCGPSDSKVKSCARPTCIPIDQATRECPTPPSADSGPRQPIVIADVPQEEVSGANETAAAGRVKVIQGSVSIVHADGQKSVVSKDKDGVLREGDIVESGKEGGAVVHFAGGNKLHVQPETQVEVKEFKDQQSAANRKMMLNLIKGKIRNQVEQKYNGKTSYYRVMTKGAVAGVRGTDFIVSHSEGAKMETRVETLGGKVIFQDLDETQTREVRKGEGAVYTAPMPTSSDFIVKGKLSEVYQLSGDRIVELDRDSRMDIARAPKRSAASVSDAAICEKPAGKLNQCKWQWNADKTACLRQRCNANGQWADETRFPASTSETTCPATGHTVKPCDY